MILRRVLQFYVRPQDHLHTNHWFESLLITFLQFWCSPLCLYRKKLLFFLLWVLCIYTVVAKSIRTLVFSPAKNWLQVSYFYPLLQCVSRKYQFTFPNSFAGRILEASWRRCHSSSGFSPSQFVLFLHVIPDRLDDGEIRSLCGALAVIRLLVQTKISLDYYN